MLAHLGKEAQSTALRWWSDKEKGTLVDLTIGCTKMTLDKSLGESAWRKYHYFLAQNEGQCEISPKSEFRDIFKQVALREASKKGGAPAADPLKSSHVIGMAIDEGARCQNRVSEVPFDFDDDGMVIFVKTDDHRGHGVSSVVPDPAAREAIVRRRRAEFAEDVKQLASVGGDLRGWESDQYQAALYELLGFPAGMGIYGAHVMSFEAGLKAGLVGAYCSVEQRPAGKLGYRPDPLHSEKSIHGSTAECGDKLGGMPQCYRIDRSGKPDCWRGSALWKSQVEHQRMRYWGERYAELYGPNRLDKYLPTSRAEAMAKR